MDFEVIKQESIGRWYGIFSSLGIEIPDSPGKHGKCPLCKREKHFRVDNKDGRGTWICTCGSGDGFKLVQEVLNCGFKGAIEYVASVIGKIEPIKYPKEKTINPGILRKIFEGSVPASKDNLVGSYLTGRGIDLVPKVLRYHPACYEPETRKKIPAMLAIVRLPSGEAVTIHRTFLDIVYGKAKIDEPKKLMPG